MPSGTSTQDLLERLSDNMFQQKQDEANVAKDNSSAEEVSDAPGLAQRRLDSGRRRRPGRHRRSTPSTGDELAVVIGRGGGRQYAQPAFRCAGCCKE